MRRFARVLAGLAAVVVAVSGVAAEDSGRIPWEIWNDPLNLARIRPDVRVVTGSSADPEGGAFDRHTGDQSRFIRTIDGEGVIFEAEGAGAVTRIWMVQGDGISRNLDPSIRLRIRLDGGDDPVVDLPLPSVFEGSQPGFPSPAVLDRRRSGGGHVSLVPIPFQKGCRVSLVGAEGHKIWFQVTAVLLDDAEGVVSFSPSEDGEGKWAPMLTRPGEDPWSEGIGDTESGRTWLEPGQRRTLAALDGPGVVTGMVLRLPRGRLGEVRLRLNFDGEATVDLPVPWFVGLGRPGCPPVRSLLIGSDQGEVYCWFPMPFETSFSLELALSDQADRPLGVHFAVRTRPFDPEPSIGHFAARMIDVQESLPGTPAVLMDVVGAGRLMGLSVTAGSTVDSGWAFLEGDETLVVDGRADRWRGTGVEDFFGGGFYFRNEPGRPDVFRRALHGVTCFGGSEGKPSLTMYRLMPLDGPSFADRFQFRVEGGPAGRLPVRWRGVAWMYQKAPEPIPRPEPSPNP